MNIKTISNYFASIVLAGVVMGCSYSPVIAPDPTQSLSLSAIRSPQVIEVAQRALPTRTDNVGQPAHYQHVYIDANTSSAMSLQTISLGDAVKSGVLASSELQVKRQSKLVTKDLQWVVLEAGYKTPIEIEGVGGSDVETDNFSEVNFSLNGTDVLNPDRLATLIKKARRVDGIFYVVGYADESGYEAKNELLSESRGKAVSELLVASGIHLSRIIYSGAGISRLYKDLEPNRRTSVSFRVSN